MQVTTSKASWMLAISIPPIQNITLAWFHSSAAVRKWLFAGLGTLNSRPKFRGLLDLLNMWPIGCAPTQRKVGKYQPTLRNHPWAKISKRVKLMHFVYVAFSNGRSLCPKRISGQLGFNVKIVELFDSDLSAVLPRHITKFGCMNEGAFLRAVCEWVSMCVTRFNLLKTKRNLLYIRNQSVPRSKHFPPQLWKPIS